MKNSTINKIIATIILIFFIVVTGALYLRLQSVLTRLHNFVELTNSEQIHTTSIFLFLSLIVLLAIILYILVLRTKTTYTKAKGIAASKQKGGVELKENQKQQHLERENNKKKEQQLIENRIETILNNLQGVDDIDKYTEKVLINISKVYDIVQGVVFVKEADSDVFQMTGTYAFYSETNVASFSLGEGISGQVAKDKKFLYIRNIPENYINILSGLGSSSPKYMVVFPIVYNDESIAIVEIASFSKFDELAEQVFTEAAKAIAQQLYQFVSIADETKTEENL